MKLTLKLIKLFLEIGIFLIAGFIVLYTAYYWGWPMLPEGMTFGNDVASAMNNVYYLQSWYPPIPGWNHLWSGGMPFLQLYPILPFITTFFVHLKGNFPIFTAAKLVMFFTLPLAALGVAVLGRILTKNWIIGILAGVIMLLQPDSWLWITFGGFYAVAFSVPFFAWCLVFYCLSMEKKSLWPLVFAASFYGLTWLSHPMAGMLATVVMAIMSLGYGIKNYGFKGSYKGVIKTMAIGILGIALFAWWIIPFFSREDVSGGISVGADQMYKVTIRELLGLDLPVDVVYITSTFYATFGVILFVLGSILAFFRRSILRWAVFACLVTIFIMTAPYYAQPIVKTFQIFWAATNVRSGLILRVLGSVIAAYGAASLVRPIFWVMEKLIKRLKDSLLWFYFTETIGGIVAIAVVALLILYGPKIIPPFEGGGDTLLGYSGYGPYRNWFVTSRLNGQPVAVISDSKKGTYSEPLFKDSQTILKELPQIFSITKSNTNTYVDNQVRAMVKATGVTDKDRLDTQPMGGTLIGMLNNYSQVGQVQGYMGTSQIQKMIGWQIDCTYYNEFCGPKQVRDIYQWFGVSQIWGSESVPKDFPNFSDSDIFNSKTLPLGNFDGRDTTLTVYSLKDSTSLASVTNKPAMLIIGDNPPNNDVYDIVFRGLTKADFGYKDAWSIRGKRFIDDYSLEELQKFEAVILHGYQYHNKVKAWNLLEKYVNAGGNLLADTGWQYQAEDWGKENQGVIEELVMPKIIPVEKTKWGKVEKGKWNLGLGNSPITEGVTLDDWGEPIWSGQSWGVASASKTSLKKGATTLLENNGQILSASWAVGKGKVIWTGFDFWGHLMQYQANDERLFVNQALGWLVGGTYEETKLDFDRNTPDLVTINFESLPGNNKLMFKEVASDSWKADLKTQDGKNKTLPIYKAGPGWRMVILPDNLGKGTVTFTYQRNKTGWMSLIISILTFILLISFFVSKLIFKDWDKKLITGLGGFWQNKKTNIKTNWQKEEE